MKTKRPTWYKQDSNTYRCGQFTITREEDDNGKAFWACRFDQIIFDRAATLAEAKSYCHGEQS